VAGLPLSQHQGDYFAASGACTGCHQNLVDDTGADVSIDSSWRASMMANSALDPFWQASVEQSVSLQPDQTEAIEALCSACHMPMASFTARAEGAEATISGSGFLDPQHPLHELAMDGVSCAMCHQIRADGLGFARSYNGGFSIDLELEPGRRVVFGPYSIDEDQAQIMEAGSGYVPVQGLHLGTSELCATCHTFFIPIPEGGEFPLQTTYLEWFYSEFRRIQTCQDCHMPEASGGVRIASSSPFPRSPFAQHSFVGSNAYMLSLLAGSVEELGLTASQAHFEAARARTLEQLTSSTASLELEQVRLSGNRLTVDVRVENLSGHKFPSGFPSRRAWIRFWVTDSGGQVVFESGAYDDHGRIIGNDNDLNASEFEQHYFGIVQPEQVQIYEAVLGDTNAQPTTLILNATRYLKDNRLLPAGYDRARAIESIQIRGRALEDEDFLGGQDRIQYSMSLGQAEGPFTVGVELLYQSISDRWLQDLALVQGQQIRRFVELTDQVPNQPIVIAQQIVEVGN
jgi:mono/diheme cytochrome c family protein